MYPHIAKIKIDQNRKIRLQILDMWCKIVREKCRDSKKKFCTMSFFVNPGLVKWRPLKQTKSKNGRHFEKPTFYDIQLCCLVQKDSSTSKVLKLPFVYVKHGSESILNVAHSTFDIQAEPCLTETKGNFRTFGVDESFWTKQQSCIS